MLLGNKYYTIGTPVHFPLNWATFRKRKMRLRVEQQGWAAELSVRVTPIKNLANLLSMPNCLFWYWLLIGVMFIEESSPAWSSPVARALFKNSQTWYAWSRHQLTTGSMLTGADNQPWLEPDCQHLWYQKLKRSVNSRISWRFGFFYGQNPRAQLCCLTHKCGSV